MNNIKRDTSVCKYVLLTVATLVFNFLFVSWILTNNVCFLFSPTCNRACQICFWTNLLTERLASLVATMARAHRRSLLMHMTCMRVFAHFLRVCTCFFFVSVCVCVGVRPHAYKFVYVFAVFVMYKLSGVSWHSHSYSCKIFSTHVFTSTHRGWRHW